VFAAFAPDEDMRVFGHGIRRRLPPMLKGDQRRIRQTYSLIFSLPGIPMLSCGEDIGMGEDLSLEMRMSVRTPMQWSSGRNAGFSTASAEDLIRPVISHGPFSYKKINVADQLSDPDSLLNWMARLINVRKRCPAIGWGSSLVLETNPSEVLAHCCEWEDNLVFIVHNLGDKPCTVDVDTKQIKPQQLTELFSDEVYEKLGTGKVQIPLNAYGYRWFTADRAR
jgi:maltose alpha-D-glucosyltransferase / alpha-amylase